MKLADDIDWEKIWMYGSTDFHQKNINKWLIKHKSHLMLKPNDTVFVPLCGKSKDMLFLEQSGYKVLGSEISSIACEQFFIDNQISFFVEERENFTYYKSERISILQGDYFDIQNESFKKISAVYDRAALVALPELARDKYINAQIKLLPSPIRILLHSLEYDDGVLFPPPFSVSEKEIFKKYQRRFEVTKLDEYDLLKERPHLARRAKERGYTQEIIAKVFLLNG